MAFALHFGRWPKGQVDHINGDRTDNRASNLREVTNKENSKSACLPKNNTTGFMGVGRFGHRYRAYIKVDGKQKSLGIWDTPEEASLAFENAKTKYGFSERHGKPLTPKSHE